MGCGVSSNRVKIQHTSAIEILDQDNLDSITGPISVVKFKHEGKLVELYFKPLSFREVLFKQSN